MRVAADGGGGGTAEATPSELQRAGDGFKALSNACGGMAETGDLQSGGQVELAAVQFTGGGSSELVLPAGFTHAIEAVTQGFLGVLISAHQQFADAAMDLYQVAGDFRTADSQIPSDARPLGPVVGLPPGVTACQTPTGQTYFRDRQGTVVGDPGAQGVNNPEDDTNNPYEQVVGQRYRPPES
jgi:hypothetical protein